jgi:hypothetical protein
VIAALIFVFSVAALIQFALSQWRAMWITIAEQPLSPFFTASTGIAGDDVRPEHFDFLTHTSKQLGASAKQRNLWLKEVQIYYRTVRALDQIFKKHLPFFSTWANHELAVCSRYAAVIVDQRLSSNLAFASEIHRP